MVPLAQPSPAEATSKFGDTRLGEARNVVDIPVGFASCPGEFVAFLMDAEIPALRRRAALEAVGGGDWICSEMPRLPAGWGSMSRYE